MRVFLGAQCAGSDAYSASARRCAHKSCHKSTLVEFILTEDQGLAARS